MHIEEHKQLLARNRTPTFSRLITDYERQPYGSSMGTLKYRLHWGQRKLLLSEIEFLTETHELSDLVVYAGAAPGDHIAYLSRLFPSKTFHLYDPRDFVVRPTPKIKIFSGERDGYFTNATAATYRDKNILFICDIRTGNQAKEEWEDEIAENMRMQSDWHKLSNAVKSMLKFRLYYDSRKQTYLSGELRTGVFAPLTSTETRLFVDRNAPEIEYDTQEYEERCFFFNNVVRLGWFDHDYKGVPGLCHCYDCRAEIDILEKYLKKFHPQLNPRDEVPKMMNEISRQCNRNMTLYLPPHGLLPEIPVIDKYDFAMAHQDFEAISKKRKSMSTANVKLVK